MEPDYKFRKSERLCSQKHIERLFTQGDSFHIYPFRVVWQVREQKTARYLAALMISVPKKRIRKAVGRNRIKRLIRESYRLQKSGFYQELQKMDQEIDLILIYTAQDILTYPVIYHKISVVLKRLILEISSFSR